MFIRVRIDDYVAECIICLFTLTDVRGFEDIANAL